MINNIKKLLSYISEGGGVAVDPTENPLPDDEEDEDCFNEELFDKKVVHGRVKITRKKPEKENTMTDLKNNSNLIKARLKSQTPQAKLSRKHSMLVRRRKIDHDK